IALVLGASITVINALDAFYDYRSLWIRRTVNLARLKNLKREMDFYSTGAKPGEYEYDQITKFKNSLNQILQDDLKEWLKLRSGAGDQSEINSQV
ncbi:MAG: SLATT domain-containing protein, partial [Anaerolineales bacterium]|nr:SLATT domain-containing protein [Anaerolineales bacterium]